MPSDNQPKTLLDMPNRRLASMVDPSNTSLPVKAEAEAVTQAVWLTNPSEVPLYEGWNVQDVFHHADGSIGQYHLDLIDSTIPVATSLLQWTQESNSSTLSSLADPPSNAAVFDTLLPSTASSAGGVPFYFPTGISSATDDYITGCPSSHPALASSDPTAAAFSDATISYPYSTTPTTPTPLAYSTALTANNQYQPLSAIPATSALEDHQFSTASMALHPVLSSFMNAAYGIPNQYVLQTQDNHGHERSHLEFQDLVSNTLLPDRSEQRANEPPDMKKPAKKSVGSASRAAVGKKTAKDSISLLPNSAKSGLVNRQTSCWRCRRYKKPCGGKGSVCDACITSGFRIWSSEIGCRRGGMDEFILLLIPNEADSHPIVIDSPYTKPPSFRQSAQMYPSDMTIPSSAAKGDVWDQFLYKIQSTGIHGPGVLELVEIAINYQRKIEKPDKAIVSAARAMSAAAEVFHMFVSTAESKTFHTTANITSTLSGTRKVLIAAAAQFLRNCLTGRLKQWFPTFLASNMNVFAYILIGDAIAAIPEEYRTAIWPNVRKMLMDLRSILYPTARDLINALSKGSQPLNMSCWGMIQDDKGAGMVRNPDGMQLVDECEATFDAIHQLQLWRQRFWHLLDGDSWMSTRPLEVDLLLITSVSRLFITPKA